MPPLRNVSQALDTEHRNSLALLGRVEQAFARPGARQDPEVPRLAAAFARLIEEDIARHFEFEERELFPRMAEAGEGDIAELLAEEHDAIRDVAAEILPLARSAATGELVDADFDALRRGTLEMVERQVSHIQKETMALLPLLDDLLDDDTDRELAFAYASN
ncbi:MAG TPA: hemerythrin domain-containing protein [Burkholderiaceae bacterium]|nr:hemerythrin domain-containing protein [Burkholderiaceae bacterium]